MNILVIRFSSLGDLVTLEPTFRAIRNFYSDAVITFLTSNVGASLYNDSVYFNEYVIKNGFFETVSKLKVKSYDLVINLQCNKPSHYYNLLLSKKRTVNKSFNLFQKVFNLKTESKSPQSLLERCINDFNKTKTYFNNQENLIVHLPSLEDKVLNERLTSKFGEKKLIAISTGTSLRWESKKWGRNNYKNLILRLKDEFGILLIGTELEIEDEKFIKNECGEFLISYVNKTSLSQLKTILNTVDLYIGNDSGPSHIAAGVGTTTVTIFGSTDIKHCVKFEKYSGEHYYLQPKNDILCAPCYKSVCPTKHECMDSITVNNVYTLIKQIKEINE